MTWEWSQEQSDALWLLTPMADPENAGKFIFGKKYYEYNRIVYGGAAFGGKSTLISAWLDAMCRNFEATRYYLGRETLKDIKESVLLTYFDWIKISGSVCKYNEQKSKITYRNGSEIYLLETFNYPADPNFDRLGSREYTAGAIEEGVTTIRRASDLLLSRTRYKHLDFGLKAKQLITLNPGDGWIKDDIVTPTFETGRAKKPTDIFVRATIASNPNKAAAEEYSKTLDDTLNDFDKARLLNGDWNARPRTGAEYFKDFSQEQHVKKCEYDPKQALHISFDENIHPYITCLIFQINKIHERRIVCQIGEICQPPPNNSRRHVCDTFKGMFPNHTAGIFVYGDATSRKNDTAKEYGENFFTDILKYLVQYRPSLRVPSANPAVKSRGGFINEIFRKKYKGIEIQIDPSCKKSISDYSFTLEDSDGGVLKKRVTNPETGISYEKQGHNVDALCYYLTYAFNADYTTYLRGDAPAIYTVGTERESRFER